MGKRILVGESDSTIQQVVSYFLNLEGFDVTTAEDGVAALEAVERSLPEVILLDPALAGINGIEVSRLIREKSHFKNVPILYIVDSIESLENMGQDIPPGYGVINKPIDPTKMVNIIKEYMDKRQQSNIGEGEGVSVERGESVSIEELLGWDVSEKAPRKGTEESETQSHETSSPSQGSEETSQGPEESSGKPGDLSLLHRELSELFLKQEEVTGGAKAGEASGDVEADLKVRISDDMIEGVINKIARGIIEKVTWDVVPKIAEEEIRKEIERLKGEGE